MKKPTNVPTPGFYYHYKHNPNGPINNYAYRILGTGLHTEDDCRPEDSAMVVYRPLYPEAFVYQAGQLFDLRPLDMWLGQVIVAGVSVPRFQKIEDLGVIAELMKIHDEMYDVKN